MKDFIQIRIETSLNAAQGLNYFREALPRFKWRQGDSDMQGPYISGTNDKAVQLMLWLGEKPCDFTISFAGATSSATENRVLVNQILQTVAPSIGEIVEILGVE